MRFATAVPRASGAYALFSSLGFRTLVAEYAPTAETSARDYGVIGSIEELDQLAATLRQAGRFSVAPIAAAETSAVRALIVGWSFAWAPGSARYVPMTHSGLPDPPNLSSKEVFDRLGPLLADPAIVKIAHDLKFTAIAAGREGVEVQGGEFDTMVGSYLIDATRSSHSIDGLALERSGYKAMTEQDITGKGVKAVTLDAVPAASLAAYAGERADVPLTIAPQMREELEKEGLDAVYRDLEQPLIPVLADIERAGIKVDADVLAGLATTMQAELDGLCVQIFGFAGCEFNINSPKQLADVLFTKLNLQPTKKTGKTRVDLDGAGRARRAGAVTRLAAARPEVAQHSEAQGHLRRRAARAGESGHRPRAHDVQSGRRGHRPAEQQRPESSEHSDPHAARPGDPRAPSSPSPGSC